MTNNPWWTEGTYAWRIYPNGLQAMVWPLTYGRARLSISRNMNHGLDNGW